MQRATKHISNELAKELISVEIALTPTMPSINFAKTRAATIAANHYDFIDMISDKVEPLLKFLLTQYHRGLCEVTSDTRGLYSSNQRNAIKSIDRIEIAEECLRWLIWERRFDACDWLEMVAVSELRDIADQWMVDLCQGRTPTTDVLDCRAGKTFYCREAKVSVIEQGYELMCQFFGYTPNPLQRCA